MSAAWDPASLRSDRPQTQKPLAGVRPPDDLIMWEGSVRSYTFADQVAAAVAGRFTGLALTPAAFMAAIRQCGGRGAVREAAADAGLSLHLDTVTGWAPIRVPSGADASLVERFDHSAEACLELVTSLDLRSILAVGVFDHGAVAHAELVAGFADLCDRAAEIGVPVNLEFMPFWGIPDLASALRILQDADRPNSGLMLDTWHFANSGADLDLLRSITDWPVHLQLADGRTAAADDDLVEATLHTRMLPGAGDLGLADAIDIITRRGIGFTAGPEVFSDQLDTMAPDDAGRALGDSTRTILGL